MDRLTPPLKWYGGKFYLADRIIDLMPRHVHYVEPYAGGLAVLLRRDPHDPRLVWNPEKPQEGVSEVVNDINGELMNFWVVLGHRLQFDRFFRILQATPFSQDCYDRAVMNDAQRRELFPKRIPSGVDKVNRAVEFFIRCRQSRQGLMKDFATLTRNRTRRGMNEQVSSWLTAIDGLEDIHQRLQRVLILNRPALEVIRTQDGPKTLFYLDPPYMSNTRSSGGEYGEYEMNSEDHDELLTVLRDLDGRFLLSGYRADLYDEYATESDWNRVDIKIDCKASSQKVKPVKTECVWMNFEPKELSR